MVARGGGADPRWTLAALCLSLVIVSLDATIVNVALPRISEDLRAGTTQLQWVADAYSAAFAGLLLLAGAIGDRLGHKFFAMTGSSFLLMQYLQLVLGYSPLTAGAAIVPVVGLTMIFAPLSGALVHSLGARNLMATGMLILAAGLGLLGVAVLGAVAAGHFAAGLAHQPAGLAGDTGSLAMALGAARHLAPASIAQVRASFTQAMDLALLVAAVASVIAALAALLGMTSRPPGGVTWHPARGRLPAVTALTVHGSRDLVM